MCNIVGCSLWVNKYEVGLSLNPLFMHGEDPSNTDYAYSAYSTVYVRQGRSSFVQAFAVERMSRAGNRSVAVPVWRTAVSKVWD